MAQKGDIRAQNVQKNVLWGAIVLFVSALVATRLFDGPVALVYPLAMLFSLFFIFNTYRVGLLAIVVLTMVFEHFFTLQPLPFFGSEIKLYPIDFLIAFTAISYFLHEVVARKQKINFGRLGGVVGLFGVISVIAFVYGISSGGDTAIAFSSFKNYFLYSVLYFLVINIVRSKEDLIDLVKAFVYGGVGVAVILLIGLLRGQGIWSEDSLLSTEGVRYIDSGHAYFLGVVVLLSIPLFLQNIKFLGKATFPLIMFQVLGIVLSLSRHLWIGVSLALLYLAFISTKKEISNFLKATLVTVAIGGVLIAGGLWARELVVPTAPDVIPRDIGESLVARFKSIDIHASADSSGLWRVFLWQNALGLFADKPFLGIGYGKSVGFDYLGIPLNAEMRSLHNSYLSILVQMGIVGLLSFGFIQLRIVSDFLKMRKNVTGIYKAVLLGGFAGYIYFMSNANFGVYFELNLLLVMYWILVGLMEISWKMNLKEVMQK